MARVYLSIGSNIDRQQHITACLDALAAAFGELTLSSVYESEAVGFAGDNFFNLVAGVDTDLGVGELAAQLRRIEFDNGRRRQGSSSSGPIPKARCGFGSRRMSNSSGRSKTVSSRFADG